MSVGANVLFPGVFPVTTPDYLTIWIVAVPNLAAKGSATTAANQSVRKKALGAGMTAFSLSPLHFQLYQIKYLPADNPRMAVFYKKLWHFAFVDSSGLGEKVYREGFLANLPLVDTMHHALQAWCIFCGVRPDTPGQWGQKGQNTECVTVQFRGIHVFRRFPANTGKQTQEFAANLYHTLCCERQNHRHFL